MANVTEDAWGEGAPFDPEEAGQTPTKFCVTEMSSAGLIAIVVVISSALWLGIASVI